MRVAVVARRLALASMLLVTAWSVWAWAAWARPAAHESPAEPATEQREEDESPAPINWTQFGGESPPFIAMIVNFGILAAGYYLFGKKPIATALENRRETIASSIAEAQRMREEAEARAKTYQAKLQRLEEDARAARDALRRAGEAEHQRIVSEAEAKAERIRRDAEFVLEQELKQLRLDLWKGAADAAVTAAAEILKQRVTPADQERLAESYLADLGAPENAPALHPEETVQ
ncbi:MAG TPA: ATP synthase F0 subunit B [Polyangiaceae bacterium]|nr:ATP synthase F0 subunit B [Polyangiaceae bacterium]